MFENLFTTITHCFQDFSHSFLQRVSQIRDSSKCPKVESFFGAPPPPPPPPPIGDSAADASVDPTPPSSTSDDSDIHRMLETIMTI